VLPFGQLLYREPNAIGNAVGYAKHRSWSRDAVIRFYDAASKVIGTHLNGRVQRLVDVTPVLLCVTSGHYAGVPTRPKRFHRKLFTRVLYFDFVN
jgi:hypothetical protein